MSVHARNRINMLAIFKILFTHGQLPIGTEKKDTLTIDIFYKEIYIITSHQYLLYVHTYTQTYAWTRAHT